MTFVIDIQASSCQKNKNLMKKLKSYYVFKDATLILKSAVFEKKTDKNG